MAKAGRRQFLLGSLRLAGGLALASCVGTPPSVASSSSASASAAPSVVRKGGRFVAAVEGDPITLDPAGMFGLPPRRVGRTIYNALVAVDEQGNVKPELVESWDRADDLTWVLRLRQGVKFHDGTSFDAEAVKFHFDRHLDPKTKSRRFGELATVDKVGVVDSATVKVTMKQPFTPFLAALFDWSGFVASPTAVSKWGQDYGLHPVGTGPFKFVEYQKDDHTTVERNPDYWEKSAPVLDQITFRSIPLDTTRLVELRSGGVQLAEDLPLQDASRLRGSTELTVSIHNGFRFEFLDFNSQMAPYGTNVKLRQAVNWAIDREAILHGAFYDLGAPGYQPFFPGTPYYDASFKPYHRDVAKAKELIASSGVPTPIAFDVVVTTDAVKRRVAEIVQSQLADVGIKLNLTRLDNAGYLSKLNAGSLVFDVLSWWGYRPDPDQYLSVLMQSDSTTNYAHLKEPTVDDLLKKGRAARTQEERVAIYRRLRDLVSDESAYIYYWEGPNVKGLSPKVKGFTHMPDGIVRYQSISLE